MVWGAFSLKVINSEGGRGGGSEGVREQVRGEGGRREGGREGTEEESV